jgi:hypothetical protein
MPHLSSYIMCICHRLGGSQQSFVNVKAKFPMCMLPSLLLSHGNYPRLRPDDYTSFTIEYAIITKLRDVITSLGDDKSVVTGIFFTDLVGWFY